MPQQIAVDLPEFEGRDVRVQLAGLTSAATILVDGKNLPYGPKKGTFSLVTPSGQEHAVRLRGSFIDPVPKLEIDGKAIRIAPALPWYVWLWCLVPVALVYEGGPIGGAIGGFAAVCNIYAFRSRLKMPAKFLITGITSYAVMAITALSLSFTWSHLYPKLTASPAKTLSAPAKTTPVYHTEH